MIEHCYCGQLLPHDRKPECEKPRVRVVNGEFREIRSASTDGTVEYAGAPSGASNGYDVNGGEKHD